MNERGTPLEETPARLGRSRSVGQTALTALWAAGTDGQPQYSAPAVGSEYVYIGGLGSTVTAMKPASGSQAWEFDRDGSLSDSSPAVADGTVYIGSGGGVLYALNETDGSVRWRHQTDSARVPQK